MTESLLATKSIKWNKGGLKAILFALHGCKHRYWLYLLATIWGKS